MSPATDKFGCPASKLSKNQELHASDIKFFRKASDENRLGCVATNADDRGFLIGVSQATGHRRRIFRMGQAINYEFEHGSVYVRNLSDAYRADLSGAFDFMLLEIPRPFLVGIAQEYGWGTGVDLVCSGGAVNPVLSHLVASVEPILATRGTMSRLFMDQLSTTIGVHLLEQYATLSHAGRLMRSAQLSQSQLARACDLLASDLNGALSIEEVARECGVSRSYFARGFKQRTGKTPHQWVISRRIAKAREMLTNTHLSLSDIALACGFADQSHFTRVFACIIGAPPGTWRRAMRN